jgi:hypothetical protein
MPRRICQARSRAARLGKGKSRLLRLIVTEVGVAPALGEARLPCARQNRISASLYATLETMNVHNVRSCIPALTEVI